MATRKSITLYHGTLLEKIPSILKTGLDAGAGWGSYGGSGVFLSSSYKGALYWAKVSFLASKGEKMESSRFDRKYSPKILAVVKVTIPQTHFKYLKADMEQAEDFEEGYEKDEWEKSLRIAGDVMYIRKIPPAWIRIVKS